MVVQRFDQPPECDVEVRLNPADALPPPSAQLLYEGSQKVPISSGWPLRGRVRLGILYVQVDVKPPLTKGWSGAFEVTYPRSTIQAEVS